MTNPEKVYAFLKKNQHIGYCDDCVGKQTGVDRHEVNAIASTRRLFPKEFTRKLTLCPQGCSNRNKLITNSN